MSREANKILKKLVFAGIVTLVLAGCAKANFVNSNSIVRDGIEYYLQTDKAVYDLGEDVQILYRITNLTDEDVTIPCLRSPEFNLWVQEDDETIWAPAHWFKWYSLGVDLSVGESKEISYVWDMRDDNGNLVEPRVYDVVGVIYSYEQTEVGVPITIIPEPVMIYYVDADANGLNDGSSWADAYNYLQDALADANLGDEIRVAQGIYKPTEPAPPPPPTDQWVTFQLINGVAIKGGYAGFSEPDPNARDIDAYETILSGDLAGNDIDVNDPVDLLNEPTRSDNSHNVVWGRETNGTAVIDGFTITGGNYTLVSLLPFGGGGGMYNDYASSPTVTNCTFSGNSAIMYGGGMCNEGGSNPTLTNCVFSGNYAGYGGGMRNYQSSPTLANCTFRGNAAYCDGGMRNEYHSGPTLTNCTFSKNSGDYGGALQNRDGSNSTVTNCILWGNTPQEIRVDALSMPVITYSDVKGGWPGIGNIDADPCFADAANGDYHLKSEAGRWDPDSQIWVQDDVNSPCIDTGDPNSDWTEELWPHGKRINMGTYGGTPQASMSLSSAGNVADLNNDDSVDYKDLMRLTDDWLSQEVLLSGDLDRNGIVNLGDFTIFVDNWRWEQ